jgi:hypothetical protein
MKNFKENKLSSKPLSCLLLVIVTLLLIFPKPVSAQIVSPVQAGHFTAGAMNIRDMAHPPPGLFLLWYNMWFSSDTYIDRNGNEFKSLNLSQIHPDLPNIDVELKVKSYAAVPALFWGSSFTLLGGARYMAGIIPNYVSADVSVITEIGGGIIDPSITNVNESSLSGFSDLYVLPLGLSWGFNQLDIGLFYGFYAPLGKYETGGSDNLGMGFWTHQFQGGHNWQISDDKGDDVYWDPSIHDRKSTIAFCAGFWPWKQKLNVQLKYGFDFGVRQRFKGSIWSLNLLFVTNALTGTK